MIKIELDSNHDVFIDECDYEKVRDFSWSAYKRKGTVYAQAWDKRNKKPVLMHKLIFPGLVVDHKDHNGLNNCRENLRESTYSQNGANRRPCHKTSKYLGVCFDASYRRKKHWKAQITKNGRTIVIGRFNLEQDAAMAYDKLARELHGEFANPNF